MMNCVYFDSAVPDDERRRRLFDGQLFVFSPRPTTLALAEHGRRMLEAAFGGIDPQLAHRELPVERFVEILAELKPRFIHDPKSKVLIQAMLGDFGCDLAQTYFDVPRMRTAAPHDYLTAGIAYAFHPHRDTWYSAPMCQLNWWFPIYDVDAENGMAFHPAYWDRAVRNGSRDYNYYAWNAEGRKSAAQQIKTDTRKQPKAEEPLELDPQIRIVGRPGSVIAFSAAQMHSTVPNI